MTKFFTEHESPIGPLGLLSDGTALIGIDLYGTPPESMDLLHAEKPFDSIRRELDLYFSGKLKSFQSPMRLVGTPFQLEVWQALDTIPYGKTISYVELARRVGKPRASRAVGAANGRNPLPIRYPCHRVIGADGSLTGYGGGLDRKRFLLELEGALEPPLVAVS